MQELGWLPGAGVQLWHTSGVLSEDTTIGDMLHSFFGYADSPTALQASVYVLYLAVSLLSFFGVWRKIRHRPVAAAS
jgi:high-affinity iron transporter